MFFGVYIQPEGARYFHESLFSELTKTLIDCNERGIIPFVGGDLNCRPGNLESLSDDNWKYVCNKDIRSNKHGRTFLRDLSRTCNIKPVIGLIYRNKVFDNDFTFFRGQEAKSQIDLSMMNDRGRKYIECFKTLQHEWHLSDHKPRMLRIWFIDKSY